MVVAILLMAITSVSNAAEQAQNAEDSQANKPLAVRPASIQQLDLGDHSISLQPEVSYQWSVTQVIDAGSQSKGVIASGDDRTDGDGRRIKQSY